MRNPDEQEKNAFRRLKLSSDGQVLMTYLAEALHEQDVQNRTLEKDRFGRGQGKSLLLDDLINKLSV